MRKRRFFSNAGQKRKYFNNLRHFGQTRGIACACLALLPMLAIFAAIMLVILVVGHESSVLLAGVAHEKSKSVFHMLTAVGVVAAPNPKILNSMQTRSIQQKIADLITKNKKLNATAEAENRDFTPQEEADYQANMALADKLHAQLSESAAAVAIEAAKTKTKRIQVLPENDPGSLVEVGEPKKFTSLGEQLRAVYAFSVTKGMQRDPRLISIGSDAHRRIMAAAGINESVPSEGGFMIQTDLASDLLQRVYDVGKLLPLCDNIEITSNSNGIKIPAIDETSRANGSRFGGVQSFWVNEATTVTSTKPKFRKVELILNKLQAVAYATDEMMQDVGIMNGYLDKAFTQEFAFRLEDGIVNGPGSGQPLGIANSDALIVVNKESAQPTATIVAANILKMYSRMWSGCRSTAVWLIDQSIEPQLFQMTITTGSGISTPIYLPPGGLSGNMYGTLLGRSVIPVEYCSQLGTQGDIYFADLNSYILARKGLIQAASSMHVNFLSDEMAFRFTMRADGQSWWNSALTPKNGGPTLSPFVTLQSRP